MLRRVALALVLVGLGAACRPVAPPPAPPIKLTKVANLPGAITIASRPGETSGIYVGTRDGRVYRVAAGASTQVLDISTKVDLAGERGFLGMTFSADGAFMYVHFSRQGDGAAEVDEIPFTSGVMNPNSARVLFTVDHSCAANHNGGSLLRGPDDLLYLALGDGGGGNDGFGNPYDSCHQPTGNAQNPDSQLGKILRFDPTDPDLSDPPGATEYTVPPDNPFFGGVSNDDLMWSLGLRNPFRMSFDRDTGDLWVGDVGQGTREEIDFVAYGNSTNPWGKGANFGWNRREGNVAGPDTTNAPQSGFVEPVYTYPNTGGAAVTGGYRYRGSNIPYMRGSYVFCDFYQSVIQTITINAGGAVTSHRSFNLGVSQIASFGEGPTGELYVASLSNGVYRIDPR